VRRGTCRTRSPVGGGGLRSPEAGDTASHRVAGTGGFRREPSPRSLRCPGGVRVVSFEAIASEVAPAGSGGSGHAVGSGSDGVEVLRHRPRRRRRDPALQCSSPARRTIDIPREVVVVSSGRPTPRSRSTAVTGEVPPRGGGDPDTWPIGILRMNGGSRYRGGSLELSRVAQPGSGGSQESSRASHCGRQRQEGSGRGDAVRLLARGILRGVWSRSGDSRWSSV
jgi:hypothetical protein